MSGLENVHVQMNRVKENITRVILGQTDVVEHILACFMAGGHVLLEGVPGLGKTLLARTLARLIDAQYRRIQFTPDLLPSDIVGTTIYNVRTSSFSFRKGPIFTQILLADEINRTPPKSQAALLEAMEEKQVTVEGVTSRLSDLFFVMGTQNPIEYEGTYPLPETQLDRFMMKIIVTYPSKEAEFAIISHYAKGSDLHDLDSLIPAAILGKDDVMNFRGEILRVVMKDELIEYIRKIVAETRDENYVQLGASPRAAIAMLKAARALSALRGSDFVTPDAIKEVALPVLRHRVILRPEALIDGLTSDSFIQNILQRVAVPR